MRFETCPGIRIIGKSPVCMPSLYSQLLHDLEPAFLLELEDSALPHEIARETVLLRAGAYVAGVPIVLSGRIKVFRSGEDRELLLYYIQPGESCVMSFFSSLHQVPSSVMARAEEDSEILLLPAEKLGDWMRRFPSFNRFLLNLYHHRYEELLHMVDQLLFWRLEDRVMEYLREKAKSQDSPILRLTHLEIAQDLGSAREVISRILKKWEAQGEIRLERNTVELLQP